MNNIVYVVIRESGTNCLENTEVSVFADETLAIAYCEANTGGWKHDSEWSWSRREETDWVIMRIFKREVHEFIRQKMA